MRQRIAGLDCAVSIASLIARYISCVNVFFFSGRRIVIVRAKSSSLTMMCSVMVSLRNVRPTVSGPPPHACDWLAPALLFTGLRGFGWACDAPGIVFLGGLRYPLERRLVGLFIDRRLLLHGRTVVATLMAETLRLCRRSERRNGNRCDGKNLDRFRSAHQISLLVHRVLSDRSWQRCANLLSGSSARQISDARSSRGA